jgi:hypothetical protein
MLTIDLVVGKIFDTSSIIAHGANEANSVIDDRVINGALNSLEFITTTTLKSTNSDGSDSNTDTHRDNRNSDQSNTTRDLQSGRTGQY